MSKIDLKIFNKAGTLLEGLAQDIVQVSAFYQKPGTTYQEFDPITLIESFNLWNVEEPPEVSVILAPMDTAYPTWQENDSANTACQWKDAILAAGHEEPMVAGFLDQVVGIELPEECSDEEENSEELFSAKAFVKGLYSYEFPSTSGIEATTLKLVVSPGPDVLDPAFYTETVVVIPVTSKAFEGMYSIDTSLIPDVIDIKLNQITRTKRQKEERRAAISNTLLERARNKAEG